MSETTTDEDRLRQWIGKSQSTVDTIHAAHAQKLAGTLDDGKLYHDGDALPLTWHWAYFLSGSLQSRLGRDGHPERGGFMPPVALPRRMWAGSELVIAEPIRIGHEIEKTSTIEDTTIKTGGSGMLCFVTVRHDFATVSGDHCFTERQTIVYREDPSPDAPDAKSIEPPNGEELFKVDPTPTLLFRYSALTFNTHRIHYDRDYCLNVESYPGLVVHGPLQATLLAGAVSAKGNPRSISFRARAPLFDTSGFAVCSDGDGQFWTQVESGGLAMVATANY